MASELPDRICIWDVDNDDPNSARGWTVSFPENHPNVYVRATTLTRPAPAACDELETVAALRINGEPIKSNDIWLYDDTTPLIARSQAEAIIAAKDREIAALEVLRPHWAKGYSSDSMAAQSATAALSGLWGVLGANNQTEVVQRAEALKADNAALTARVNSAEEKLKTLSSLCEEGFNREKSLEAKLVAANKALEWYEEHVSNCRKIGSIGDPSCAKLDRDGGAIARAALESKP